MKPLSEEEIEQTCLLCDECVGKNLYSREEIAAAINASDKFFYLLKTAQGETVGYIYYYLTSEEYIARYAKLDVGQLQAVYSASNKRVGKIQSVGLKAEYRGIGLAAQMIRFCLQALKEISIEAVFIVCWKPGGVVRLRKALAECDFRYLAEAKKIWYDNTELICPYCRGRCLCNAEVFYKLL